MFPHSIRGIRMKERFEGTENPNLLDALKRQELVGGDLAIAGAFAKHGEVLEFQKNDKLIVENAEDTEVYLLLAGAVAIVVKGNHIRTRLAGTACQERWLRSNLPRKGRRRS